ncbi:quinol:cytochrome C oxidoreductase [Mangrovibacterium marinum]|uniref:Quinol:cytochrome c oxidoreductase quinone-binding subunit 2 n=1 Tax=Mangrovibacterium marinum TaxID=1639118 RepID=A0A2T5C2D3_9BACT|nr:quinol:cytochrome C oxidoreductase [Mangrovibacterium marinum]PTN08848.1 quinol:cytochrome c oxidoreductase quinone-binding subunit 2 [Mangrovibacterium marinum]
MIEEKFVIPKKLKLATYVLIAIGLVSFGWGFVTDPQRSWANYLLNNYLFVSLAVGAAFFISIQYIAQAGWSAAFKRIPEAMAAYLPFAAVFFLLLLFGVHSLYEWSHAEELAHDHLIQHKSPYLNVPFWGIRILLFFGLWILLTKWMRKISLKEDREGGMRYFYQSEHLSKVFIFIVAVSFSAFSVDMLMSLQVHWFSTIFAAKMFISAFLHGAAVITLIVIILHKYGYLQVLNRSHLHDFTRYMFMLSIVWGYFTFSQFMLIWYGNIPEETSYYVHRWHGPFQILFYVSIILNWFIPFLFLMPRSNSRSKLAMVPVIILLIIGQYVELYYEIWPATLHEAKFGLLEIGSWLGFAGLFSLIVITYLAKANLVPKNHPYLEESIHHHF